MTDRIKEANEHLNDLIGQGGGWGSTANSDKAANATAQCINAEALIAIADELHGIREQLRIGNLSSNGMNNENTMKLYLISQTVNHDYDTFDMAVVAAYDEDDARSIMPMSYWFAHDDDQRTGDEKDRKEVWCDQSLVNVEYLGIADESVKYGVVCASFNAG